MLGGKTYLWVDIQRLLACSRMSPDERMDIGDWLPPDDRPACSSIRRLFVARMDCLEAMQTLLELGTQPIVGFDHIPESAF